MTTAGSDTPPTPRPEQDLAGLVGARIRELRGRAGLSLSELARRAGLGKGTLSELESGHRNPTLETLYSLAGPLGAGLAELVGPARPPGYGQLEIPSEHDDPVRAVLLDVMDGPDGIVVEVYRLTFAGDGLRRSPSHGAGVLEQLTMVSGRALVGPAGAEQPVCSGETVSWVSDGPHTFRALEAPAVGLLVITNPARRPRTDQTVMP